uniref:engulfment and cell motility protein 1-like n=1 Tax=Styela clava TaxID=7725 RepID=UPI00193AD8C3|nr:engulfment and cell motility protein 1-like [Styela clava]
MSRQSSHIPDSPISKGSIKLMQHDKRLVQPSAQGKRDVVKVAVEVRGIRQLYEMDQTKRLQDIIKDLCKGDANWQDYSLQVIDEHEQYITEANQHEVKDGTMLRLVASPNKTVVDLMQCLRQNTTPLEDKVNAYKRLSKISADPTFADIFIQKKGLHFILESIEKGTCQGDSLAHGLGAVIELLDHGTVMYDNVLSHGFIRKVSSFVKDSSENDATILQRSLAILEAGVINSQRLYNEISQEITAINLTTHVQRSNPEIQHNTIALINALLLRDPNEGTRITGRKKISNPMTQKQFRTVILNHIIRTSKSISSEMAHQLYVLQVLTFNLLEERMNTKLNPHDSEQRSHLFELRNIAFDSTSEIAPSPTSKRPQNISQFNPVDFKKLGFENFNNPVLEFEVLPPGIFALDCMRYFARNQQDNYVRLVLENSARGDKHECPFAKSSVRLVKMICEILNIGEQPTETGEDYYAMFFTHDHAIEEFYCICIQLLNKTWKEMSAIKEDFDKVMSVVHDQILIGLTAQPQPSSLDIFKSKLYNYSEILKIRRREMLEKEEFDSQAKPVLELQKELKPEILDLVKEQRLNVLKAGTVFHKISSKKFREKSHWCCRLSHNHKYLHYCDVDSNKDKPSIEEMTGKLEIADCKDVIFGKSCPHMRNQKVHKATADLAFSISYDPDEFLNFVAPDKETWMHWADGMNALLGKPMSSDKAKLDMDMLLAMEMKLRLLELENIHIPDHPPPIPPPPDNFNFAYNY